MVLHIPASQSLKDKRQVVKSLLAQVQREYHLSAAEVERQDEWQIAVIGLACVTNSGGHANQILSKAITFIEMRKIEAELLDFETEVIHAL